MDPELKKVSRVAGEYRNFASGEEAPDLIAETASVCVQTDGRGRFAVLKHFALLYDPPGTTLTPWR